MNPSAATRQRNSRRLGYWVKQQAKQSPQPNTTRNSATMKLSPVIIRFKALPELGALKLASDQYRSFGGCTACALPPGNCNQYDVAPKYDNPCAELNYHYTSAAIKTN